MSTTPESHQESRKSPFRIIGSMKDEDLGRMIQPLRPAQHNPAVAASPIGEQTVPVNTENAARADSGQASRRKDAKRAKEEVDEAPVSEREKSSVIGSPAEKDNLLAGDINKFFKAHGVNGVLVDGPQSGTADAQLINTQKGISPLMEVIVRQKAEIMDIFRTNPEYQKLLRSNEEPRFVLRRYVGEDGLLYMMIALQPCRRGAFIPDEGRDTVILTGEHVIRIEQQEQLIPQVDAALQESGEQETASGQEQDDNSEQILETLENVYTIVLAENHSKSVNDNLKNKKYDQAAKERVDAIIKTYLILRTGALAKDMGYADAVLTAYREISDIVRQNNRLRPNAALQFWKIPLQIFSKEERSKAAADIEYRLKAKATEAVENGATPWIKEIALAHEKQLQTKELKGELTQDFEDRVRDWNLTGAVAKAQNRLREIPVLRRLVPQREVAIQHYPQAFLDVFGTPVPFTQQAEMDLENLLLEISVELPKYHVSMNEAEDAIERITEISVDLRRFARGKGILRRDEHTAIISRLTNFEYTSPRTKQKYTVYRASNRGFEVIEEIKEEISILLDPNNPHRIKDEKGMTELHTLLGEITELITHESKILFNIPSSPDANDVLDAIDIYNDNFRPASMLMPINIGSEIPVKAATMIAFFTHQVAYSRARNKFHALEKQVAQVGRAMEEDRQANAKSQLRSLNAQEIIGIVTHSLQTEVDEVAKKITAERAKINQGLASISELPAVYWPIKATPAGVSLSPEAQVNVNNLITLSQNVGTIDFNAKPQPGRLSYLSSETLEDPTLYLKSKAVGDAVDRIEQAQPDVSRLSIPAGLTAEDVARSREYIERMRKASADTGAIARGEQPSA